MEQEDRQHLYDQEMPDHIDQEMPVEVTEDEAVLSQVTGSNSSMVLTGLLVGIVGSNAIIRKNS